VTRVSDAQWMSHATFGWFVFGLEWQHRFTSDVPRDALLLGVRLPIGLWWQRERQKAEATRSPEPRWTSRDTAVKQVGSPPVTRPKSDDAGAAVPHLAQGSPHNGPDTQTEHAGQVERRELARASLADAQRAREQGDVTAEAFALARAYDLSSDPELALQLSAATEQLGKYVAGLTALRHALQAASPSGEQRTRLEAATARLQAKLPHLRLTLEGASGDERVLIDGVHEPTAPLGYDVPVDPGEHRLTVERQAQIIAERTWQARDGELVRVVLELTADSSAQ
jgi:hypothetical protein